MESHIIGGSNAPASGISYQVTFRTILTPHWCGGSIINNVRSISFRIVYGEIILIFGYSAGFCLQLTALTKELHLLSLSWLAVILWTRVVFFTQPRPSGGNWKNFLFKQCKIIQTIRIHPSYNRVTFANDVALLQTATPFVFNARVQPVQLGSNFVGGGVTATISG